MIVAGEGTAALAQGVADALDDRLVVAETKTFPDGERYVRVPKTIEGQAVVIASAYPPDRVLEPALVCDAARRAGAEGVHLVVPYLTYARQDRVFQTGEALSAEVVGRLFGQHCDAFTTVEPHKELVMEYIGRPSTIVSASKPIAVALKQRGVDLVLAPDKGALGRATEVAEQCGAKVDFLEKTRIDSQTVEVRPKSLAVDGSRVAVVDDIISTGGTMATALGLLKEQGAAATYAVGVHGLFIGAAESKLKASGVDEILATDTVAGPHASISVAGVVAEAVDAKVPA